MAICKANRFILQIVPICILFLPSLPGCANAVVQPAVFSVSNVDLEPEAPHTSELFTISCTVTNSGGQQGSYEAVLYITRYLSILEEEPDSTRSYSQTVAVAPGESKMVTFESLSLNVDGIYKARIEDLHETFEVGC